MFLFILVIWYQSSQLAVKEAKEELRWRTVSETPQACDLLTTTQFLEQCTHTPNSINDIVFNGRFALTKDYCIFSEILNNLPNIRRISIVNANLSFLNIGRETVCRTTDIIVRGCALHCAPRDLLSSTKHLHSLDLSCNMLSDLDSHVLTKSSLRQLQTLNISNNQLSCIPSLIKSACNLSALDLSNNRLTALHCEDFKVAKSLQVIDISYNYQISDLPAGLVQLPRLRELKLTDLTALSRPKYDLAKKGLASIKKFYVKKRAIW